MWNYRIIAKHQENKNSEKYRISVSNGTFRPNGIKYLCLSEDKPINCKFLETPNSYFKYVLYYLYKVCTQRVKEQAIDFRIFIYRKIIIANLKINLKKTILRSSSFLALQFTNSMGMAFEREITPVSYNLAEKIDLIGETGDTRFSFRVTGWQMADSIEKSVARTDSLKTRTRKK